MLPIMCSVPLILVSGSSPRSRGTIGLGVLPFCSSKGSASITRKGHMVTIRFFYRRAKPYQGNDQYRLNSSPSLTGSHHALADSDQSQLQPLFLLSSICFVRLPVGNSGFLRDTNWWQVSVLMARGLDKTRLAED